MKKHLIYITLFLFLISFAFAAPKEADEGGFIDIEAPMLEYYKLDGRLNVHIHAHNETNGLILTNDSIDCLIHVYNDTSHIAESVMKFDSNGIDWEYEITNEINKTGMYAALFYCNNSDVGGFHLEPFTVNLDGLDPTEKENNMLTITLSLFGIIVFFFVMGFVNKDFKLKLFTLGIGLIEVIFAFSLLYARELGYNIAELMRFNFYAMLFIGFGTGMIAIIMYLLHSMDLDNRVDNEEDGSKWDHDKWK